MARLGFTAKGFNHIQIKREGAIALIKRWKGEIPPHFEVVRWKLFPQSTMPNGDIVPEGERYPSSHRWGMDGFTYIHEVDAQAKYAALVAHESRKQVRDSSDLDSNLDKL